MPTQSREIVQKFGLENTRHKKHKRHKHVGNHIHFLRIFVPLCGPLPEFLTQISARINQKIGRKKAQKAQNKDFKFQRNYCVFCAFCG